MSFFLGGGGKLGDDVLLVQYSFKLLLKFNKKFILSKCYRKAYPDDLCTSSKKGCVKSQKIAKITFPKNCRI